MSDSALVDLIEDYEAIMSRDLLAPLVLERHIEALREILRLRHLLSPDPGESDLFNLSAPWAEV